MNLEPHLQSDNVPDPCPAGLNCALLVLSCDAYADLWRPCFTLLERHWPDCPFSVFLGAGAKNYDSSRISVLRSGAGRDWSQCVIDYLDQLSDRHVLLMLDDFFLRQTVRTTDVLYCLRFAQDRNCVQIRLVPRPRPTNPLPGEKRVGESVPGSPYRLSTQAAIWDRAMLRALLRPGESIWDFEHEGNARTHSFSTGFFSVWRPVLPYEGRLAHHVVEKGRWLPHEKWIFARQDIGCDFFARGTLSGTQTLLYHLARTLDRLLDIFPWRTKIRLKSGLKYVLRPLLRNQLNRMAGKLG